MHEVRRRNGSSLVGTSDSVSDGAANADYVAGTEDIRVVQDVIVVGFGTNEQVPPDVVADAATEVNQEVVGTGVARAECVAGVAGVICVKAGILPTDTGEEVGSDFLGDSRLVDAVEVEDDGAIGLTGAAEVPNRSPGRVETDANAAMEDNVGANVGVKAAAFGANEIGKTRGIAASGAGRNDGTESQHCIALLGNGQTGESQNRGNNSKEGELSQEKPPNDGLWAVRCRRQTIWMQSVRVRAHHKQARNRIQLDRASEVTLTPADCDLAKVSLRKENPKLRRKFRNDL